MKCPTQRCGKAPYREGFANDLCRKHLIEAMDYIARQGVLDRDEHRCVRCGSERVIQWSHWPSRSYHATRWRPEGAVAHCSQCHLELTYKPLEHEEHVREFWDTRHGDGFLDAIKRRALDGASGDFDVDLIDVWDYLHGVEGTTYGTEIREEAGLPASPAQRLPE